MTSHDPRLDALLQHKGSLTSGERWRQYDREREPPRLGTFHNVKLTEPPIQTQGSKTMPRDPYLDPFYQIGIQREPLKPRYTEKLPTSPAFKSVAELAQRRRDFWSKIVARGGIALMIAAPLAALKYGAGTVPAGAFIAGLITFVAVCFVSGNCRSRV